jgi:hypothetical protein
MGMTMGARLAVTLALLLCVGCTGSSERSSDPVITHRQLEEAAYPTAEIVGALSLEKGCLMIGDAVVFWPASAAWDAESQSVTFAGDFKGAAPAKVGTSFQGGGGAFELSDDLTGMLSDESDSALRECATKTGTDRVVMAWPADS